MGWKRAARSFLSGRKRVGIAASDKAPKKHRLKALQWLVATNNMLAVTTGQSYDDFRLCENEAERGDPSGWKTLTLLIDQGSDGWAAGWFLKFCRVCVNILRDPSHRMWNNCKLALVDAGLWPFVQILCIVIGADCGPWDDAAWFQKGKEAVELYLQLAEPGDCPLFAELIGFMLRDRQEEHRQGEAGIAEEIWESLKEVWQKKNARVPTTRWFGIVNSSRDFLKHWHRRLLVIMVLMITLNMGNNTKPHELLKAKLSKAEHDADVEKAAVKRDTADQQTLRNSCKNTLELVHVVLSDASAKALARVICGCLEPAHSLYHEHHVSCRSVETTLRWYIQMAIGKCLQPLIAMCRKLQDLGELQNLGLATQWPLQGVRGECCVDHPAVIEENWLANHVGTLTMRTLGRMMVENSWYLYGYPGSFPALLSDEHVASTLLRMEKLWNLWHTDVAGLNSAFWKQAKKRSVFTDMYVLKVQHSSPSSQLFHRVSDPVCP